MPSFEPVDAGVLLDARALPAVAVFSATATEAVAVVAVLPAVSANIAKRISDWRSKMIRHNVIIGLNIPVPTRPSVVALSLDPVLA